jgi:hypothetical protein
MKLYKLAIIIVLVIIFYLVFFIGRPDTNVVASMDSYYFLNYIWGYSHDISESAPLSKYIFDLFPKSLFVVKLTLLLIGLSAVILFSYAGESLAKKYGWLTGLIILSGISYSTLFLRFEDDLFGLPFIALGFYYLIKFINTNSLKYKLLSIISLILATLLWKFSVYFIFLFWIVSEFKLLPNISFKKIINGTYIYTIVVILLILCYGGMILGGIIPDIKIAENMPIVGVLGCGIMLLGIIKAFRFNKFNIALIVFFILTLINLKFIFLLYPILVFNVVYGLDNTSKDVLKIIIFALCVLFLWVTINNVDANPSRHLNELFEVYLSLDNQGSNVDWSFGYYYIWYNKNQGIGNFNNVGNYRNDKKKYEGIILTINNDQNISSCEKIYKNKAGIISRC